MEPIRSTSNNLERESIPVHLDDDEVMRVLLRREARLREMLDAHVLAHTRRQVGPQVGLARIGIARRSSPAADDVIHPICQAFVYVVLDEVIEQMVVPRNR